jgi:CRISPR/Cas system-associated exonuclease Cas4 (RecB family)
VPVAHSESLLAEVKRQGTEVAEAVKDRRFEARPDRRRCRLCPYRLACADAL